MSEVLTTYSVFRINLLNATDGSPHHLLPNNIILWDAGFSGGGVCVQCAKMTASRLMLFVSTIQVNILIVWDWRTWGVVRRPIFGWFRLSFFSLLQVLKRSSTEDRFLRYKYSSFSFLDEFRLLTATGQPAVDEDELDLIIFDTSLPQQSPDSWRRLNIAPMYHPCYARYPWTWEVRIRTESENSREGAPCNGPLVVDPTQSVVVIILHHQDSGSIPFREAVLVIRTVALVRHMFSNRFGERIPWEAWKRDVMVVEIPHDVSYNRTFVHGTRVLLVTHHWQEGYRFHAYDFSRRGCRTLVRVGDGEMERMVIPNPEKVWLPITPDIGLGPGNMWALGDSLVTCTVGNPSSTLRSDELTTCARRIQLPLAIYTSGSWPSRVPSGSRIPGLNECFYVTNDLATTSWCRTTLLNSHSLVLRLVPQVPCTRKPVRISVAPMRFPTTFVHAQNIQSQIAPFYPRHNPPTCLIQL